MRVYKKKQKTDPYVISAHLPKSNTAYALNISEQPASKVFSLSKDQTEIDFEGKVDIFGAFQPKLKATQNEIYTAEVKNKTVMQNTKTSFVKSMDQHDEIEVLKKKSQKLAVTLPEEENNNNNKKQKISNIKPTDDKKSLLDRIFDAFNMKDAAGLRMDYLSMRELKLYIPGTVEKLFKPLLNKVAVYHPAGPNSRKYSLKPEYKTSS